MFLGKEKFNLILKHEDDGKFILMRMKTLKQECSSHGFAHNFLFFKYKN